MFIIFCLLVYHTVVFVYLSYLFVIYPSTHALNSCELKTEAWFVRRHMGLEPVDRKSVV